MKIITALGLMSGTSMDGIDLALIRSDGQNFIERGQSFFVPYDKAFRQRIESGLTEAKDIKEPGQRPGVLAVLEYDITRQHAGAIEQFIDTVDLDFDDIDVIGFHGQTVLHRPDLHFTVQLGNGQQLCDATGIEVIYDMRANDMRHGGQGAPLVPVYHRALARNLRAGTGFPVDNDTNGDVAFINIGGISNITYVGKGGLIIAFDCGPGNGLIDQWMSLRGNLAFDKGGAIARCGKIVETICNKYLAHPYFDLPFPKSADRNDFEPLSDTSYTLADGARSLVRVSALGIVAAARQLPKMPQTWIICGGGAKNLMILEDLRLLTHKENVTVMTADQAGFNSMAMEAEAFAYLAIRSKIGANLTYPSTTGCQRPVTGGILAKPSPAPKYSRRVM